MIIRYLSIALLFFTTSTLLANQLALFEAANEAYKKGEYNTAIKNYESILEDGNYSHEIYYNLGNAYFKTNDLGKAVLNYERALLIAPRDMDILFNLEIAKAKTKDDLDKIGKFFLAEWWQKLHNLSSSNVWGGLTILSLWGSIAGFILWLFGSSRTRKKQGFIGGIALFLLSFLLFCISNSQANFEQKSQSAIVIAKAIALKNAPDAESTEVLEIHEGLKVALLDQIGDWYKVKLSNGDQGWLPITSLEEI